MATAEWGGYQKLQVALQSIYRPDPTLVLEGWQKDIVEDNRAGVLSSRDKDGNPAPPLRYRNGKGKPTAARKRGHYGTNRNRMLTSSGDNLTTAEYRKLTGPRLAPRGARSRVIANLVTGLGYEAPDWFAEGVWLNVLNRKGEKFLDCHFDAKDPRMHYDLRGVRPEGMQRVRVRLLSWALGLLKGATG